MASTSSGGAAAASANPRKFKEKIAEHKRREEEETAAFQSIMDELNSVKGQQRVSEPALSTRHAQQRERRASSSSCHR